MKIIINMVNEDEDDVQKVVNFYVVIVNDHLWSMITPSLDANLLSVQQLCAPNKAWWDSTDGKAVDSGIGGPG